MNNNRGNNRRRGRGNNRQQGGGQLNRIDSRARGNAPQLLEKYRKLAHDAHLNGDRVTEEYYLQFADHYFRVIADTRQRQEEQRQRREDRWQEGADGDENEYASEYAADPDYTAYDQPHRREREERGRQDDRQRPDEREQRGANARADEARADEAEDRPAGEEAPAQRSVYEPAENPFVRENRSGTRGLRPRREERRPRRTSRSAEAQAEDDTAEAPAALDPTTLPPPISAPREEAVQSAPAPEAEAKPRRRTRRPKPPADDPGETLEAVS